MGVNIMICHFSCNVANRRKFSNTLITVTIKPTFCHCTCRRMTTTLITVNGRIACCQDDIRNAEPKSTLVCLIIFSFKTLLFLYKDLNINSRSEREIPPQIIYTQSERLRKRFFVFGRKMIPKETRS